MPKGGSKMANPYLKLQAAQLTAAQTQPLDELQRAIGSVAVQGASQVKYRQKTAAGGSKSFTITPALPVTPVGASDVAALLTPQPVAPPPTPTVFQTVRADGTVGTNWTRVALAGALAAGAVVAIVYFTKKGRRR